MSEYLEMAVKDFLAVTALRPPPIRLRGHDGARTWTGWAILTYNLDTLAVQTP